MRILLVSSLKKKKKNQYILVIDDTTAAPALYIVGQSHSGSLCSSLKYTIHEEDFHTYAIQ